MRGWGDRLDEGIILHFCDRISTILASSTDAEFLTDVEASLTSSSSALFAVVSADTSETVIAELANIGGTLLKTPLPDAAQQQLKNAVKAVD